MKSIEIKVPILSIDKIDDVGTLENLYTTFEIIEVLQRNLALTFVEHFFSQKEFKDVIALTFHQKITNSKIQAIPLFSFLDISSSFQEIEDEEDLSRVIWNTRYSEHNASFPLYFGIQEITAHATVEYFKNKPIQLARQFKELSSFIITRENFQLVHQQCFTEKQFSLLEKILIESDTENFDKTNYIIQQLIKNNQEVQKSKNKI